MPQGVSGAIKRRGGLGPFKELGKHGSIPFGGAVLTSAGRLPFKAIIHVAGINMLWRASEWSIRQCVRNAMALAHEKWLSVHRLPADRGRVGRVQPGADQRDNGGRVGEDGVSDGGEGGHVPEASKDKQEPLDVDSGRGCSVLPRDGFFRRWRSGRLHGSTAEAIRE